MGLNLDYWESDCSDKMSDRPQLVLSSAHLTEEETLFEGGYIQCSKL